MISSPNGVGWSGAEKRHSRGATKWRGIMVQAKKFSAKIRVVTDLERLTMHMIFRSQQDRTNDNTPDSLGSRAKKSQSRLHENLSNHVITPITSDL